MHLSSITISAPKYPSPPTFMIFPASLDILICYFVFLKQNRESGGYDTPLSSASNTLMVSNYVSPQAKRCIKSRTLVTQLLRHTPFMSATMVQLMAH